MSRTLRVVSYNVRYFGHALRGLASTVGPKRRIAGALLSMEPLPDIICFQEVETISIRSRLAHRKGRPEETQLEAFMERFEQVFEAARRPFPYEAFYFRADTYRLGARPLYTTGLAILINQQTLRVDAHNVDAPHRITFHHVERWKDKKQSRICAHMRLSCGEQAPLHIFNTHLSLPTPFAREFWATREKMGFGKNQLEEAKTLVDFIRQHAGGDPFIVCGDFNTPPGSPVYRYLTEQAKLVGAQAAVGQIDPKVGTGFPTAGFMHLRMHLDHLFAGGRVQWNDVDGTRPFGDETSPFYGLSDHMPLIGRFTVD